MTMSAPLSASLAATLYAARLARELTASALAERSGVSRAMIGKIERGEAQPTAALLGRLSAALGMTLSELVARARHRLPSPCAVAGHRRAAGARRGRPARSSGGLLPRRRLCLHPPADLDAPGPPALPRGRHRARTRSRRLPPARPPGPVLVHQPNPRNLPLPRRAHQAPRLTNALWRPN